LDWRALALAQFLALALVVLGVCGALFSCGSGLWLLGG
jgi:hypothetical protein